MSFKEYRHKKAGWVFLAVYVGYKKQHSWKALAAGNLKAASCSDCHGAHDAKNVMDSSSRISR